MLAVEVITSGRKQTSWEQGLLLSSNVDGEDVYYQVRIYTSREQDLMLSFRSKCLVAPRSPRACFHLVSFCCCGLCFSSPGIVIVFHIMLDDVAYLRSGILSSTVLPSRLLRSVSEPSPFSRATVGVKSHYPSGLIQL